MGNIGILLNYIDCGKKKRKTFTWEREESYHKWGGREGRT
jgi:hypothetical protein